MLHLDFELQCSLHSLQHHFSSLNHPPNKFEGVSYLIRHRRQTVLRPISQPPISTTGDNLTGPVRLVCSKSTSFIANQRDLYGPQKDTKNFSFCQRNTPRTFISLDPGDRLARDCFLFLVFLPRFNPFGISLPQDRTFSGIIYHAECASLRISYASGLASIRQSEVCLPTTTAVCRATASLPATIHPQTRGQVREVPGRQPPAGWYHWYWRIWSCLHSH